MNLFVHENDALVRLWSIVLSLNNNEINHLKLVFWRTIGKLFDESHWESHRHGEDAVRYFDYSSR